VMNGASEFLAQVFADLPDGAAAHARSAVGVASLPMGAPVEVEMIVRIRSDKGE
jgi:enamine deaminase RidA (YjgF/YER057c/UK114 family)